MTNILPLFRFAVFIEPNSVVCVCHILRRRSGLYDASLPSTLEKSSNGENGYYRYILACFNKWPVHRLHGS